MTEPFPKAISAHADQEAEKTAGLLMGVIGVIRNIRSEMLVPPSARIEVTLICPDQARAELIERESATIINLARCATLTVRKEGIRPKGAAAGLYEDLEVFIPMQGLVDIDKETARLAKDRDKLTQDLQRTEGKLKNEKFVNNAPPEVVEKEREKISLLKASLLKIEEGLARLEELS
jgi:valyl-tRNA synthetase